MRRCQRNDKVNVDDKGYEGNVDDKRYEDNNTHADGDNAGDDDKWGLRVAERGSRVRTGSLFGVGMVSLVGARMDHSLIEFRVPSFDII